MERPKLPTEFRSPALLLEEQYSGSSAFSKNVILRTQFPYFRQVGDFVDKEWHVNEKHISIG